MKIEQKAVLIFGGTSEGRKLCEHLYYNGIPFTACVATAYGEECLAHMPGADIRTGRLTAKEIADIVTSYALVLDATHPYAQDVTAYVSTACAAASVPYLRVFRPSVSEENALYFKDIPAVCAHLSQTEGKVLVTTGSKELAAYKAIPGYEQRLYVRVLPCVASIGECLAAGIPSAHIIAMQGPFSTELNAALLRQTGANFLVTKESGAGGGYAEKIAAASALGAMSLVVGRPTEETGLALDHAIRAINHVFSDSVKVRENDVSPSGYFPLFFNLKNKRVVVVGGGKIALRRVKALLPFGACITVVAPNAEPELAALHTLHRAYESKDITGAFFVLAATNDPAVNLQVAEECRELGIPVNRCDNRNGSDFYFPALFQNETLIGGLVSKRGDSHGLVKKTALTLGDAINRKEDET